MKHHIFILFFILFSLNIFSQDCTILSKANDITPDKLCSPVTVEWIVTYTGVNNAGTSVSIRYDWNNGRVETILASEIAPGVFQASATNVYTSSGNICNYHPQATLIVNGVLCTSSAQEQIVTVWDDDDHNGGRMRINPVIYPICFGDAADVRFQDLTRFNCVPPQERDNPNVSTRWIRWTYGTDNTMMGQPVTIAGRNRTYPFSDDVITLLGPVTGSGVWSNIINVANDKQIGEYFEVTLHNWNYCNPYDDPNIPGGPRDRINGDHLPVVTTAIILIVPYPDATIYPIAPMCENGPIVTLTAHDTGGVWAGPGVINNTFNPMLAGNGEHIIQYSIINANNCRDIDTAIIKVLPIPNAIITPVDIVCLPDLPFELFAIDSGGVWLGPGLVDNIFEPSAAGIGNHLITYNITVDGCSNSDQILVTVATPDATINPVDTLCINSSPVTLTAHDLGGIWTGKGIIDNVFHPIIAGAGNHLIVYNLNNPYCNDIDSIIITVMPISEINIEPLGVVFLNSAPIELNATPGGGTWEGLGILEDIFYPEIAGIGTHLISYKTLIDKYGCFNMDTIYVSVIMPPAPVANFGPDTSGCSPLTVQFINKSLYGEYYLWYFDDGTFSSVENPVHTYYIPGNYIVRLTVSNISGQSTYSSLIKVFRNPTAIFEAFPIEVISTNQIVVFYNYSYYGSTYLWNFGDGETSIEVNPWHKYKDNGEYQVTLYVTSADGCLDSMILTSPIKVDYKIGFIKFPNAFVWNRSGPTGGYWTEGQIDDYVFRPFFENVIEYRLQIFNRWGVLIYESNDLYKGWDGYYNQQLSPQGVYVWRVVGQYADGSYFNEVGDVTFLH